MTRGTLLVSGAIPEKVAALAADLRAAAAYDAVIEYPLPPEGPSALTAAAAVVLQDPQPDRNAELLGTVRTVIGGTAPLTLLIEAESPGPTPDACGSGVSVLVCPVTVADILNTLRQTPPSPSVARTDAFPLGASLFLSRTGTIIDTEADIHTPLTEKEAALLRYFYRNANRSISRDELLKSVWDYGSDITTRTVETYIYRLRQKMITPSPDAPVLETTDGGYRLRLTGDGSPENVE